MKRLIAILIPVSFMAFFGCQKELSLETGGNNAGLAVGALKDSAGNCDSMSISGTYRENQQLTDSHYVNVTVNVTTPGQYKIRTDTVNGFYFRDSGYFSAAGTYVVKLKGGGKPIIPVNSSFNVSFGNSFCNFSIAVGTAPASGTVNSADTAWMFNDATRHYQGHVDSALVKVNATGMAFLKIYGKPVTADTTIFIELQLGTAATSPTGTYSTSSGTAIFEFKTPTGAVIYQSRQGDGSNTVFTITNYNTTTKVDEAIFSGTAKDGAGATQNITAGKLKVQVQ